MTPEQTAELEKWSGHAVERQAIEDFIEMAMSERIPALGWGTGRSLNSLLDEFFEIDRVLLETARRALLTENAALALTPSIPEEQKKKKTPKRKMTGHYGYDINPEEWAPQ